MAASHLAGWDWETGFADLEARFEPGPAARLILEPAEALAAAVRHFRADRLMDIRETRAVPALCSAPHLGLPGEHPVWVSLILGVHRLGAASYPGEDPLHALGGGAAVLQAVVDDRAGTVAFGVVVPVALHRPAPD